MIRALAVSESMSRMPGDGLEGWRGVGGKGATRCVALRVTFFYKFRFCLIFNQPSPDGEVSPGRKGSSSTIVPEPSPRSFLVGPARSPKTPQG